MWRCEDEEWVSPECATPACRLFPAENKARQTQEEFLFIHLFVLLLLFRLKEIQIEKPALGSELQYNYLSMLSIVQRKNLCKTVYSVPLYSIVSGLPLSLATCTLPVSPLKYQNPSLFFCFCPKWHIYLILSHCL